MVALTRALAFWPWIVVSRALWGHVRRARRLTRPRAELFTLKV